MAFSCSYWCPANAAALAFSKFISAPNIALASNSFAILLSKSNNDSDDFAALSNEEPIAAKLTADLANSFGEPLKYLRVFALLSAISFITCCGATPANLLISTTDILIDAA